MISIYLTQDRETMVVHDNVAPYFMILNRQGEQSPPNKVDEASDETPRRRKSQKHEKPKSKGGRKVMHCKICGEPGKSSTHPNHGKKKTAKPKKRHGCSKCGKPGHNAKTCPEGKSQTDFGDGEPKGSEPCSVCHSEEHNTKDCPDIGAEIAKLQEYGKDSLRIAAKLRIPLKLVNQYWNSEKAVASARGGEEEIA